MKLRKLNNGYYSLYDSDGDIVASNNPDTPCSKKLSKENCDEIFRVVDVEKLADEYIVIKPKHREHEHNLAVSAYIEGFNKAMELNKDKLFTVDDLYRAFLINSAGNNTTLRNFFEQTVLPMFEQPTEIEVDIEMETKQQLVNGYRNQPDNIIGFIAEYENVRVPKLDENGCLILKKK